MEDTDPQVETSTEAAGGQPGGHDVELEEPEETVFVAPGPLHSVRVWVVLGGILLVIAVGILYVYQAGDQKTVLGNQPIPAAGSALYAQPAAYVQPAGQVAAMNVPVGGRLLPAPIQQAPIQQVAATVKPPPPAAAAPPVRANTPSAGKKGSVDTVQCPHCGTKGLPMCSICGSVMHPLGQGRNGLYFCPSCGVAGVPLCPRCGTTMTSCSARAQQVVQPQQPVQRSSPTFGGQFQCPTCGATGLPNWSANGTPLCPNCATQMQVRRSASPSFQLAAAP